MPNAEPSGEPHPSPAILTPAIDLLSVGGLSLLVLVPLLLSGVDSLGFVTIGVLAWGQAVLNYSHFMASFRIVYRSREMILRHKWASIGVPLLLIGCMVLALAEAQGGGRLLLTLFFTVASGYLAWHYTGQVWGMMASYAYVEGVPFAKVERLLIRLGLRLLLAWHVLWFLRTALANPGPVESLYLVVSAGAVLAFGLGAVGLWQMRVRTGKLPPLRVLVPWLALFAWYGALARWGLPALFLVQAFHALQYIQFPMRVELNRAARSDARGVAGRMALYMIVLLLAAGAAILVVPGPAMSVVGDLLGVGRENLIPLLVMYTINIHHYFTDGVVWKLSNPEVRRELFAHLQSPQPTPAAVPASGARRGRRRR